MGCIIYPSKYAPCKYAPPLANKTMDMETLSVINLNKPLPL